MQGRGVLSRQQEAPGPALGVRVQVPSQLGPEEQRLLAWHREGYGKGKFRDERGDSAFGKQQVYLYTVCLRRSVEGREQGTVASDEAGEVNGDLIMKGWA